MKTFDEFNSFYSSGLLPELKKLEEERKALLPRLYFSIGCGIITGIIIFFLAPYTGGLGFGIGVLLFFGVRYLIFSTPYNKYKTEFKQRVMKPLIEFIDPHLKYESTRSVSQNLFSESDIFRESITTYAGDDFVEGKTGKTAFSFSELNVIHGSGKSRSTIFSGIFFVADFNKNFKGKTVVLNRSFFGRKADEVVKLENPDFEREYTVYSSDQVEARYILSPALMERIMKFRAESDTNVLLSFVNSSVFMAISLPGNLFEPKLFSDAVDKTYIKSYFSYMELILGIVDDLNLNTRIWTKQ
ncbi:MAG TPA: DUF3137 domain-containing protein [Chitinophagales bacterium]|nr:DUF3137 domain-containing protein [Chitinophagales bacterium]